MSSLNDLLLAIAAVQKDIQNGSEKIRWAYPYPERQLVSVPFFINLPQMGGLKLIAMGGVQETTPQIDMHLCLQPAASGTSLASNIDYVCSWFDVVNEAFLLHLKLGGNLDWVRIALITEWAIEEFTWGAIPYFAIRFGLSVAGNWKKTIGETS
jgi:hypothetical protein